MGCLSNFSETTFYERDLVLKCCFIWVHRATPSHHGLMAYIVHELLIAMKNSCSSNTVVTRASLFQNTYIWVFRSRDLAQYFLQMPKIVLLSGRIDQKCYFWQCVPALNENTWSSQIQGGLLHFKKDCLNDLVGLPGSTKILMLLNGIVLFLHMLLKKNILMPE